MIRVSQVMTAVPVVVRHDDSIRLAAALMREGLRPIRHLPVLREGKLVGVVSQRDLLRSGWGEPGVNGPDHRVGELLGPRLHVARPGMPLRRAISRMRTLGIGCLPVVDDECRCVGIVTPDDVMRVFEAELRHRDGDEIRRRRQAQSRSATSRKAGRSSGL